MSHPFPTVKSGQPLPCCPPTCQRVYNILEFLQVSSCLKNLPNEAAGPSPARGGKRSGGRDWGGNEHCAQRKLQRSQKAELPHLGAALPRLGKRMTKPLVCSAPSCGWICIIAALLLSREDRRGARDPRPRPVGHNYVNKQICPCIEGCVALRDSGSHRLDMFPHPDCDLGEDAWRTLLCEGRPHSGKATSSSPLVRPKPGPAA